MRFPARHQTGMQTVNSATLPHHLEVRTPLQPDHQLVLRMRMRGRLRRQIEDACFDHVLMLPQTRKNYSPLKLALGGSTF